MANHSSCHTCDSHLCESPVIEVNRCSCKSVDPTCGVPRATVGNIKELDVYTCSLGKVHNNGSSCGCGCSPKVHYEELCNVREIKAKARCIKYTYSTCDVCGEVPETIREIPSIKLYIVNYEFINLCLDEILGCLREYNLGPTTVCKVKEYVNLYYEYYGRIQDVGSIHLNAIIELDESLMVDPEKVDKTKAILYAIDNRLNGKVCPYEQ